MSLALAVDPVLTTILCLALLHFVWQGTAIVVVALVIGSALLLLSAFWHQARGAIVRPLPENLRNRLPILDRTSVAATQPAA